MRLPIRFEEVSFVLLCSVNTVDIFGFAAGYESPKLCVSAFSCVSVVNLPLGSVFAASCVLDGRPGILMLSAGRELS